jgi:hypothetical protein
MTEVLPMPPPSKRSLADLEAGQEGRITELEFPTIDASSPLRPGVLVYMVESGADGWRHVRIDFREYSIPVGLARKVSVAPPEPSSAASASTASELYEVLLSRRRRGAWLVRVVRRIDGAVIRVRRFDTEDEARVWWQELRGDASSLSPEAFRSAHGMS